MTSSELIGRKTEEDGVEILVLKNPPVNALSTSLIAALGEQVAAIGSDRRSRVVIVTGDGQYFSAGADVKEMAAMDMAQAPQVVAKGLETFARLENLATPVIAAINGLAIGGGLELALSCDMRIAGESAKLGAPETKLGLIPAYGGTQRLPRLVGAAKAKELVFTGAMIGAADALRIGLVNKTVPAPFAEGLALESELFRTEVLPGKDLPEGLAAFVERRPPKFPGA
ncbi:MAG: enoyl-CoA hydratase-related protein [Thermoplasmatales archaeon]|nr:enoyl-CoA hydratase-related protein [Thermoplasmatales archaeon]